MRLFFDTSVLVAAMVETHPAHERALAWLQRIRSGTDSGIVSAHSIAELYAILTTLPIRPRITPQAAHRMIRTNVPGVFEVVTLTENDYTTLIDHLASLGVAGGATYDALILHAAAKADPEQIVTLNERDFRRVYPELAAKIVVP